LEDAVLNSYTELSTEIVDNIRLLITAITYLGKARNWLKQAS